MKLDEIDLKILQILQGDATTSSAQMGEAVGMSQSPTWRRMMNLDQSGAIKRRVTIVDRNAVGLRLMVYVLVRLKDQTEATVSGFQDAIRLIPEVLQGHVLMGDIDFMLLIVTRDMESYRSLIREKLSKLPGVLGLDSRVVVEEAKNTTELPLYCLSQVQG